MPEMSNKHAERIRMALISNDKNEDAEQFSVKLPLPKSPDFKRNYKWAGEVCDFFNNRYSDEESKQIREKCACGPSESTIARLRDIFDKSKDLLDFVENAAKKGENHFSCDPDEPNVIYITYSECYCSQVKRVPDKLPAVWCYCTLGYSKRMFEGITGRTVSAELIESVKTGGEKCLIKVTIK